MEKKYFNEKHEAVIVAFCGPVDKQSKEGVNAPHNQCVGHVRYIQPEYDDIGQIQKHTVIVLHRELIMDLADQIRQIESDKPNMVVENALPF